MYIINIFMLLHNKLRLFTKNKLLIIYTSPERHPSLYVALLRKWKTTHNMVELMTSASYIYIDESV